jgi:hypothetical protein
MTSSNTEPAARAERRFLAIPRQQQKICRKRTQPDSVEVQRNRRVLDTPDSDLVLTGPTLCNLDGSVEVGQAELVRMRHDAQKIMACLDGDQDVAVARAVSHTLEAVLSISRATVYTAFVMDRREFLLLKKRSTPREIELSCKWLYEQCVDSQVTPTVFDAEVLRRVFDDLDTRLRGVQTVRVTHMNWLSGDLRLEFGSLLRAFRSRGGQVIIER